MGFGSPYFTIILECSRTLLSKGRFAPPGMPQQRLLCIRLVVVVVDDEDEDEEDDHEGDHDGDDSFVRLPVPFVYIILCKPATLPVNPTIFCHILAN